MNESPELQPPHLYKQILERHVLQPGGSWEAFWSVRWGRRRRSEVTQLRSHEVPRAARLIEREERVVVAGPEGGDGEAALTAGGLH